MKRQLTTEQERARDERRTRFRALVKQIGAMKDEERTALAAKCSYIVTVEEHTLSPTNACLTAMQCPAATIVGGYRQWLKHGRAVRRGEHGISIWIPSLPNMEPIRDGEVPKEAQEDIRFFGGTVFDISQTQEISNIT